ncbi:MAG: 50S ribosomal protein L6 [Armatimonadetes bacterium]|nr:50S ribosomal protein L6 [Armatimonadota bacterium]
MSRVGLRPIPVPSGVTVSIATGSVTVKGPKGELSQHVSTSLTIVEKDGMITLSRPDNHRVNRSQHGLARTLISNMIEGVTNGHGKTLEIHGVGFRAAMQGKVLTLLVGYSHDVTIEAPEGITIEVSAEARGKVTEISVSGIDKALVGQIAANIRKVRKPDPYKGKGLRYKGEYVKLRPGKRAITA